MARIYYKNANGDYIRDVDGKYLTGEPTMPGHPCCCGFGACDMSNCIICSGYETAEFEVEVEDYGTFVLARTSGCNFIYSAGATSLCGELMDLEFRPAVLTSCGTPDPPQSNWNVVMNLDNGLAATRDARLVAAVCISSCAQFDTLNRALTFNTCLTGTGGSCNAHSVAPLSGRITRL